MLKVFFADAGSTTQLIATLESVEKDARDRLLQIAPLIKAVLETPEFPDRLHISALTLRLQYAQETSVLTWSRWARNEIQNWNSTSDPGRWNSQSQLQSLIADIENLEHNEPGLTSGINESS